MSGQPAVTASASAWPVLVAPAHWQSIDFISDLHLQASEPATFLAWQQVLRNTTADALFILGDLFEVWVGDDVVDASHPLPGQAAGFEARCQHVLADAAKRLALFFMPGNRDFLLGERFAAACSMTLLPDPTVLAFDGRHWLLSHGDELCLGDTDYQRFRQQVRTPAWREAFLAKPLDERQAIARALRQQSEARKSTGASYADVDSATALQWLAAAQADTLIHGHTHRPADHWLARADGPALKRLVLSDWDLNAVPQRHEVLRLRRGAAPERFSA